MSAANANRGNPTGSAPTAELNQAVIAELESRLETDSALDPDDVRDLLERSARSPDAYRMLDRLRQVYLKQAGLSLTAWRIQLDLDNGDSVGEEHGLKFVNRLIDVDTPLALVEAKFRVPNAEANALWDAYVAAKEY